MVLIYDDPWGGLERPLLTRTLWRPDTSTSFPTTRVVQAVDFVSDDPASTGTMRMTWEVNAVDGGTCVTVTADDVPDSISAEDHATGLASSLANLADYVAR